MQSRPEPAHSSLQWPDCNQKWSFTCNVCQRSDTNCVDQSQMFVRPVYGGSTYPSGAGYRPRSPLRERSLTTGGGGLQNRGGGQVKYYPYEKRGKGGRNSLSHAEVGGGGQKTLCCSFSMEV